MKRDFTVTLALLIFVPYWLGRVFLDFTYYGLSNAPEEALSVLDFVIFLAMLRIVVLWFQTLIHAMSHGETAAFRVSWLLLHLFLAPVATFSYYYTSHLDFSQKGVDRAEEDLKRRANDGTL